MNTKMTGGTLVAVVSAVRSRWGIAACLIGASSCAFDPSGLSPGGGNDDDRGDAGADPGPGADATVDEPPLPDGSAVLACPDGYQLHDQTGTYYRTGSDLSWTAAEGACEADGAGAHLVVVDDELEAAAVDALSSASRTWIGYSDRVQPDSWLWITGGAGWSGAWDTGNGEPSGTGDCAAVDGDGSWRDENCSDTRDFLCECDGRRVDPASF